MIKVAVTELEYKKGRGLFEAAAKDGLDCLPAPCGEAELAAFIRERSISYAIVGVERYSGALYEALPKGGLIARFGVGHDGIDKAKAKEKGVLCVNAPGALDNSVAEMAVALMLSAARSIPRAASALAAGDWNPRIGLELSGRTLAVVGCGAIGRKLARIASLGLGMRVLGYDLSFKEPELLKREFGFSALSSSFEEAVRDADFVSLHIPGVPATKDFINAKTLSLIPSRAILVNTARGMVVDEDALFDSLSSGALAGAALDVFKSEPYAPASPERDLRKLPNVVTTPHMGSSTAEACGRMASACLENVRLALAGRTDGMSLLKA